MPVRDLIIQSIFFLLFLFALKKKTLERCHHIFKRVPKTNPHKNKQQTKQYTTRQRNNEKDKKEKEHRSAQ